MHETRFINEIITLLKEFRLKKMDKEVSSVSVSLDSLSHVTPEGLKEAFSIIAAAEGFGGVDLKVRPIAFKVVCGDCGYGFESSSAVFHCSSCHSPNIDVKRGREFVIDSLNFR